MFFLLILFVIWKAKTVIYFNVRPAFRFNLFAQWLSC